MIFFFFFFFDLNEKNLVKIKISFLKKIFWEIFKLMLISVEVYGQK